MRQMKYVRSTIWDFIHSAWFWTQCRRYLHIIQRISKEGVTGCLWQIWILRFTLKGYRHRSLQHPRVAEVLKVVSWRSSPLENLQSYNLVPLISNNKASKSIKKKQFFIISPWPSSPQIFPIQFGKQKCEVIGKSPGTMLLRRVEGEWLKRQQGNGWIRQQEQGSQVFGGDNV